VSATIFGGFIVDVVMLVMVFRIRAGLSASAIDGYRG
jgi:hypothetical protein